jgi:hypothetical protein
MKKKLVASLAAAMILGVAGTSFAASNPFVDVPANNWAYGSVSKLAQAGIIDGYGDGTFKGDKTITRYEMAQMVAKAMGNEDKANAEQKAEIKKLQAEFSDELDKLGVRVSTLEKNQSAVKFSGVVGLRYQAKDDDANADKMTVVRYRLRLDGSAKVDDDTTFGVRFSNSSNTRAQSAYGIPKNGQWSTFGSEDTTTGDNASIDRVFITRKFSPVTTATAGRQALVVGTTQAIVDNGNTSFDGIKLTTKFGAVNAAINHGRLVAQKDIDSVELSTKTGKLSYGAGYFQMKDNAGAVQPYGSLLHPAVTPDATHNYAAAYTTYSLGKDMLDLTYGNVSYNFTSKLSLTVEGGQNNADYANDNNKFYTALAKIGDQTLNAKGKQNFVVQYYKVGANALALDNSTAAGAGAGLTTLDTTATTSNYTGWDFSYNRGFSKNLYSEFHYVKIDDKDVSNHDYNYFRVNVYAKF